MSLGLRIRELRKKNKLKLAELAAKSGVQLATLSRIENGKMTGTLQSHIDIAKALGVDVVELYQNLYPTEAPKSETPEIHESAAEYFTYNDRASYEILTTKLMYKKMLPVILRIEPGGITNPEQNPAGSERFIFILEGEILAYIGKETYQLKVGSSLYFDAALTHHFENKGKKPVRIMSVVTPVTL